MRGRNFQRICFSACLVVPVLTSCTTLPSLESPGGVTTNEVVIRVKCELLRAFWPYLRNKKDFDWLNEWTAQVDLRLNVQDQAVLNPTASLITPLPTVLVPGVGNVMRNFTLGLNANSTTSATREETITFSLSFKEIENEMRDPKKSVRYHNCILPDGRFLNGDLGLDEWIESALSPAVDKYLTKGHHKSPKGGSSAKSPSTPPKGTRSQGGDDVDLLIDNLSQEFEKHAQDVRMEKAPKPREINKLIEELDTLLKLLYFHGRRPALAKELRDYRKKLEASLETRPALDPPIDTLTHQAQFFVSWSAGASPTWTLVKFRGPGQSGTLLSLTRSRTHTLTIVLGNPGSGDVATARAIAGFSASLTNALRNLPATPAP